MVGAIVTFTLALLGLCILTVGVTVGAIVGGYLVWEKLWGDSDV